MSDEDVNSLRWERDMSLTDLSDEEEVDSPYQQSLSFITNRERYIANEIRQLQRKLNELQELQSVALLSKDFTFNSDFSGSIHEIKVAVAELSLKASLGSQKDLTGRVHFVNGLIEEAFEQSPRIFWGGSARDRFETGLRQRARRVASSEDLDVPGTSIPAELVAAASPDRSAGGGEPPSGRTSNWGTISTITGAIFAILGVALLTFGTWCGTYLDVVCSKATNLVTGIVGNLLTVFGPIMVVLGYLYPMLEERRLWAKSRLDEATGWPATIRRDLDRADSGAMLHVA